MKHPTHHFNAPQLVTVPIRRLNPVLLSGDRERINEFLDIQIERERDDEAAEALAEMPIQTLTPEDINRMSTIDLEKVTEAQRLIPIPNYRVE